MPPSEHNRRGWDRLASLGHHFSRPPTDEELLDPLGTLDGLGWLGPSIAGERVLCLAAGGGRQGPLYAAAGAEVTVVDISESQLDVDRQFAAAKGLSFQVVRTSMEDLSMFADATFDIVVQPVSTCYIPRVDPVYAEVARVLRCGGLYISQHKSPTSLQSSLDEAGGGYRLETAYYHAGPLPAARPSRFREGGTIEYLHRWESLLGSMCRKGLFIEDVAEPFHGDPLAESGSFAHRCHFIAPYIRVKARRRARTGKATGTTVWLPE